VALRTDSIATIIAMERFADTAIDHCQPMQTGTPAGSAIRLEGSSRPSRPCPAARNQNHQETSLADRIYTASSPLIMRYLESYCHENVLVLSDLRKQLAAPDSMSDPLSVIGYCEGGSVRAVQSFYRHGRWFPHFVDPMLSEMMIADMRNRHVQWIMGVRRVVDPLLDRLAPLGYHLGYDEADWLCHVRVDSLRPRPASGVRRATQADTDNVARLRADFEVEYFGVPEKRIDWRWCRRLARRYIDQGVFVAERGGETVSMAAVEASIPQLSQVGAVFTRADHRGCGLAKGVVTALCQEQLATKERVILVVKTDNRPALATYRQLGFRRWTDYRMARFD